MGDWGDIGEGFVGSDAADELDGRERGFGDGVVGDGEEGKKGVFEVESSAAERIAGGTVEEEIEPSQYREGVIDVTHFDGVGSAD